MPRIPVRTEPYNSPSRQHRHYKNKRDQVLRILGRASYINSSHFLLCLVNASGTVETFASDAFQFAVPRWIQDSGIADEASKLVLERGPNGEGAARPDGDDNEGDDSDAEVDAEDAAEDEERPQFKLDASQSSSQGSSDGIVDGQDPSPASTSQNATPIIQCDDVFGGGAISSADAPQPSARGLFASARLGPSRAIRKVPSPLDIASANKPFASSGGLLGPSSAHDEHFFRAPKSAPLPNAGNNRNPRTLMRHDSSSHANDAHSKLKALTLQDRNARTAFLELRFSQMQQSMCKTVAKAWIKIIEPKKQTRCPYNKGEEGKPEWWPEGVRHKEPDHLMKPERHALLLTILRSPKIEVARLRLATAEVVAMIRADRVELLMDVYRIAREEEALRKDGKGDAEDLPINVKVSSLDGWRQGQDGEQGGLDEEGKRATMGDDVPEVDEKRKNRAPRKSKATPLPEGDAQAGGGRKKRRALGPPEDGAPRELLPGSSLVLQRSVSTPGVPQFGPGQDAIEGNGPSAPLQRSLSQANVEWNGSGPGLTPQQAEAQARAEASRRQVASDAVNNAVSAGLLYGQANRFQFNNYDQHLSNFHQPMSAAPSSQYFDYNFVPEHALQQIGTMSAPQGQHAQLYPEQPMFPQQQQHQQQQPQQHQQQQQSQHSQQHPHSQHLSTQSSPMVNTSQFPYSPNFAFGSFDAGSMPNNGNEQQAHNVNFGNENGANGGPSGALGLQGVPASGQNNLPWSQSFDGNSAGFVMNTGWNGALPEHMQMQHSNQMGMPGSAPARMAPLPDVTGGDETAEGDSTMDRSFNTTRSTIDGPSTPPQQPDGNHLLQPFSQQSDAQAGYTSLSDFYNTQSKASRDVSNNAFDPTAWTTSDAA